MRVPLFYIQNTHYCGNCLGFWCVDGKGYTCNLDEAWKVTKKQAESICSSRPKEDIAWPVEAIDALVVRHVTQLPELKREGR